jgi:small conductance mechanosensitive channel
MATTPATPSSPPAANKDHSINLDKVYDNVYEWIITNGPRFLIGLAVLFVGLWVIRIFANWSHIRMHQKNVDPTLKPFLMSLLTAALRIILILFVVDLMGIHMTLFTALVGAFGVAAGLALSGTLQNFASGILILLLKPFVVGDNIIAQGMEGTVTAIQIFYTTVKTFDNRSVILPNSLLSNNMIVNISREGDRRLDIIYKFSNSVDVDQAKKVLNDAIDKCVDALDKPERRIGISVLDSDTYTISINVWVHAHGFEDTRLKIQEVLLQTIKASGLKIGGV